MTNLPENQGHGRQRHCRVSQDVYTCCGGRKLTLPLLHLLRGRLDLDTKCRSGVDFQLSALV